MFRNALVAIRAIDGLVAEKRVGVAIPRGGDLNLEVAVSDLDRKVTTR